MDTQSVLDWLYFDDPRTAHWEAARLDGQWVWMASAEMRGELAHVLGRGHLPTTARSSASVLAAMDGRAQWQPQPVLGHGQLLRCTDRDDQKFIDAAIGWQVQWLVSRDKAVLKLGRRAHRLCGLLILRPTDWMPDTPPAP